jgi:uncharacterized membrane-anchored protein
VRNGERPNRTKVERLPAKQKTAMTYMQQFESELVKKLQGKEDTATVIRWICEQVLQSYKNGITAGQNGAKVIRKGQSRRRGIPSQAL